MTAYSCEALVYPDTPMDSCFQLLLQDFSEQDGWHQVVQTDLAQTQATLHCLARLHAFLWLGPKTQALATDLWPVATYWDGAKQPGGQEQTLQEVLARVKAEFVPEDEWTRDYGSLLARYSERLDREVHGGEKQAIIHGDAKSANFFYKTGTDGEVDVGVIDFQWTGAGADVPVTCHSLQVCVPQI